MRQRYVAEKKKKKIIFSLEKCMSMATVFQELGFQEPRLCQRRHDPKGKEKKELWQFSLTLLFSFDNFFVESFLTEKTNSDTWDFTVVEVVPDTSLLLGRDLLLEPIWSNATSHREGLLRGGEKTFLLYYCHTQKQIECGLWVWPEFCPLYDSRECLLDRNTTCLCQINFVRGNAVATLRSFFCYSSNSDFELPLSTQIKSFSAKMQLCCLPPSYLELQKNFVVKCLHYNLSCQ